MHGLICPVQHWYDGEKFEDWNDCLLKFRAIFIRTMKLSDRWDLMKSRVQGKEERILEFYLDKVRLCKDLNLSFDEIRDHVLQSLRTKELAVYALGRVHRNTNELLADLQDYERLVHLRNTRYSNTPKQNVRFGTTDSRNIEQLGMRIVRRKSLKAQSHQEQVQK